VARWRASLALLLVALVLPAGGSGPESPQEARRPAPRPEAAPPGTGASQAPRDPPDFSRQVMVTLPPGPTRLWDRVRNDLAAIYGLRPVYAWPLPSIGEQCIVFDVPKRRTPSEVARLLERDRRVASAQPIQVFQVLGEGYNDPYAHLQHGVETLHLGKAHGLATGKGVKVALVDTGVDLSHPDLAGKIVKASNFVSWGDQAFTGDAHGTAVAGVVAADANNHLGIVGVAPGAEIYALKACWHDPPGSRRALCNSYTLAQAIDFALREGAQVMNMSLAGPPDPILGRLIDRALAQGMVVVAASSETERGEDFPASLAGVLAVRVADLAGELRAPPPGKHPAPALAAPGVDVLSTAPHGAYDFFTGSSFAAAQVSGVVALLLEQRPDLKPQEILELLESTARPVGPGGGNPEPAGRLVNACAALARLLGRDACQ
jgi:subtilisin family serine protease